MNNLFSALAWVDCFFAFQQQLCPETDLAVGPFPACALKITLPYKDLSDEFIWVHRPVDNMKPVIESFIQGEGAASLIG